MIALQPLLIYKKKRAKLHENVTGNFERIEIKVNSVAFTITLN